MSEDLPKYKRSIDWWVVGYLLAKYNQPPQTWPEFGDSVLEFDEGFTRGAVEVCQWERLQDYRRELCTAGYIQALKAAVEAMPEGQR